MTLFIVFKRLWVGGWGTCRSEMLVVGVGPDSAKPRGFDLTSDVLPLPFDDPDPLLALVTPSPRWLIDRNSQVVFGLTQ